MDNVPVKLKSSVDSAYNTVQLERYVAVGGHDVRRRVSAPTMEDEIEPEVPLTIYHEIQDICGPSRLHLNTGVLKFEHFRQMLRGNSRTHWDEAAQEVGGTTNDNFRAAKDLWLANYMEPTAFHDQKQYLSTATKPFSLTCKQLASRLTKIKTFMAYMPGAPPANQIYPEPDNKMLYYNLMLPRWKTTFDAAGHRITDPAYTYASLKTFMEAQERCEAAQRVAGQRRARGSPRGGAGRGSPRAGRQGRRGRPYGRNYHQRPDYQHYSGQVRPYYEDRGYYPNQRARYSPGRYSTPGYEARGRSPFSRSPASGRYSTPSRGRFSPRGGRGRFSGRGRVNPARLDLHAVEDVGEEAAGEELEETEAPVEERTHWAEDQYFAHEEEQEAYGDY